MNDTLNLLFALIIASAICARIFNEFILFLILCGYSVVLCISFAG